jgi:UDP-glucose 4-epimerase
MKYLITGGAGFIGSHLADALIDRGDSIEILDNLSTGSIANLSQVSNFNSYKFISGSILDDELVNKLVASVDYVMHFAAAVGVFNIVNQPLASFNTNVRGTENILAAANKYHKPVLIASSSEIYGKNSSVPLNEESDRIIGSPLKSRWSYSAAKALDEALGYFYYLEHGLPVRLVRLFNTVGPRQVGNYGMVLPRFISAALSGEDLVVYGDGSQSRCFSHIKDVITAILKVNDAEAAIGEVFNIGNDQEISIMELAKLVVLQTGSKSAIVSKSYEDAYGSGFEDLERRVPDISKINRVLGWEPSLGLDVIIRDIVAFNKSSA